MMTVADVDGFRHLLCVLQHLYNLVEFWLPVQQMLGTGSEKFKATVTLFCLSN